MGSIKVHRPDQAVRAGGRLTLAARRLPEQGAVLTLVDNSKPRARAFLDLLGRELQARLPAIGRVEIFSKPSAAKPIESDEAVELAARSHLVITGVGD